MFDEGVECAKIVALRHSFDFTLLSKGKASQDCALQYICSQPSVSTLPFKYCE